VEGKEFRDGCRLRDDALPVELVLGRNGSTVAMISSSLVKDDMSKAFGALYRIASHRNPLQPLINKLY
jgi:hypothetical protein